MRKASNPSRWAINAHLDTEIDPSTTSDSPNLIEEHDLSSDDDSDNESVQSKPASSSYYQHANRTKLIV